MRAAAGCATALSRTCIEQFPTPRNAGRLLLSRAFDACTRLLSRKYSRGGIPLDENCEHTWRGSCQLMPLRILIADDSRSVRHSLHGLLEQHPDWVVCAEAVDGTDAVAKAQQYKPDIVVMDFFMPGMTGVEAARVLGRVLPSVPVLIVTLYITAELIKQAKAAGAKGAAPKGDTHQILNGVEAVVNQETFFEAQAAC